MLRTGKVISADNGQCVVEFERHEACNSCHECKLHSSNEHIKLKGDYSIGDYVEVELSNKNFLKAATIAYLLPLLSLLLGMFIGSKILPYSKDNSVLLGGIIGLITGVIGIKIIDCHIRKNNLLEPKIIRKVAITDNSNIPTFIINTSKKTED